MFQRYLKIAPLPARYGSIFRADDRFVLPQDYLIEWVVKFQCHVDRADGARAIVPKRSRDISEFLIQKIVGFRHLDVFEVDVLGICLLGGTKRQLRSSDSAIGIRSAREKD